MHGIAHCWNKGSLFTMNRYHFYGIVYVRDDSEKPSVNIYCKERIPQGCGFSVFSYRVDLMSLAKKLGEAILEQLKPLFADDLGSVGKAEHAVQCLEFLFDHIAAYGYHPEVKHTSTYAKPRTKMWRGSHVKPVPWIFR